MSLTACCAVSETSDRDVIKNHEARLADVPEQPANQSSRQALTPVFTLVDWRINLLVGYECSFLRVTFKQGVFQTVRVPDRQTDRWQENERPEESRVGKECRSRWSPYHHKKKQKYT